MTKTYDQTTGELCEKCGWSMKFPDEPCRCELERENAKLREDKERLDWIIGKAHYLFFKELGSDLVKGRDQIDAARKEPQS